MKNTFLKLLCTSIFTLTFSVNSMADGGLEGSMKQMARSLRTISRSISNPTMNTKNAELADKFVQAATKAKALLPEEIQQLPTTDQAKRKALYEEMIDHAIELGEYLGRSLKDNDQEKAKHFLDELYKYEKEGHSEFKENDLTKVQINGEKMALATTLKAAMKNMGSDIKLIQAQMADASLNQESKKLAEDFVANARDVKSFIPASISKLPSEKQQARMDLYNKLTDKSIDMGTKLSEAFSTGNNAAAQVIINDLLANKKEGHFEFN
jgi:hypothetical protein